MLSRFFSMWWAHTGSWQTLKQHSKKNPKNYKLFLSQPVCLGLNLRILNFQYSTSETENCSYGKLADLEKTQTRLQPLHHGVKLFVFLEMFLTNMFWILIHFQTELHFVLWAVAIWVLYKKLLLCNIIIINVSLVKTLWWSKIANQRNFWCVRVFHYRAEMTN